MEREIQEVYLCSLDVLHIKADISLGDFYIRNLTSQGLASLVCTTSPEDEREQIKRMSDYPCALTTVKDPAYPRDSFEAMIRTHGLSYAHAGGPSWYPFADLIRVLNLMKQSAGPVIPRNFYRRVVLNKDATTYVERVVSGKPYHVEYSSEGQSAPTNPAEYTLVEGDQACFHEFKKRLDNCLADKNHQHMLTAIHFCENGDRRIRPQVLAGPFDAIDPLMSYEACLEALVICETERGVEKLLSKRISRIVDRSKPVADVENFVRRIFWLRSKFAHGVRSPEYIERLIIDHPNGGIDGEPPTPPGPYDRLFLESEFFPGFIVNLREIGRLCIAYCWQKYADGMSGDDMLKDLE